MRKIFNAKGSINVSINSLDLPLVFVELSIGA